MLQMTLHLSRSSPLWTFQLLGFEKIRLQKKRPTYFFLSRVQIKSWAGEALETVNCFFLKRRLIGAC
jgi:hypothetical protein